MLRTIWMLAVLGAAFFVAACSTPDELADRHLAPADTVAQRVYRAAAIYHVAGDYACEYLKTPTAFPGTASRVAVAADRAYAALSRARAHATFGGDTVAMAALGGLLEGMAAETLDAARQTRPVAPLTVGSAVDRLVTLLAARQAVAGAWAQYKTDLAVMLLEARDPTEAEMNAVMDDARDAWACVQGEAPDG